MNNTAQSKFIQPIINRNESIEMMKKGLTQEERIKIIKERFNLYHGKGKRKRKK